MVASRFSFSPLVCSSCWVPGYGVLDFMSKNVNLMLFFFASYLLNCDFVAHVLDFSYDFNAASFFPLDVSMMYATRNSFSLLIGRFLPDPGPSH